MPVFRSYCVERWAVDIDNDLQEVTSTCSGGYVERIAGANSWTADIGMFVDYFNDFESPFFDPAPNNVNNQATLNLLPQFCDWNPGQRVLITLRVGGPGKNATTFHELQGFGLISKIGVENPAKNPVKMSVQVMSSGPIKYVISQLGLATPLFLVANGNQASFADIESVVDSKTPKTPDTHATAADKQADKPVLKA